MFASTCDKPDCTVAATGKCLLSHENLPDCPHCDVVYAEDLGNTQGAIATGVSGGRKFHLGVELGTEDALDVMRARYAHVIGVLGSTNSGKTCLLSSLYLMASGGALPRPFEFAGSLTLQAFEDRVHGLRQWSGGQLPSQLTDHTVLSDPRQPSLLHLALRESEGERRRFDLLLTDLPGEWIDNLVLRVSHVPSFQFLQRADGILLLVDGVVLMSDSERHAELRRMRYFCERLAGDVNISRKTPFVIVISKSDEIDMQLPATAAELRDFVSTLGFPVTTVPVASFSRKPERFKSGTGVFTAIEKVLTHRVQLEVPLPNHAQAGDRTFSCFRG